MNRRRFTKTLALGAASLAMSKTARSLIEETPRLAITIDDFNFFGATSTVAAKRNRTLLDTLRLHSDLKAAAFICGRNVDSEMGKNLVAEWSGAGHIIANHTYSHWYYPGRKFEDYTQDILRVEPLIKDLTGFRKYFRFPMLKEGDTAEKRDNMRLFLARHGYRMGYVTIDASDWYIDERLRARLSKNPNADLTGYKKYYLNHLWDRAVYYNSLSRKALGRSVKHTLLIHHNVLNETFLADALTMFERKGWKLINAEEAFTDPVFDTAPNILPAGESIIWALAKESGKFNNVLRYPGEDGEYEKPRMDKLGL
ncbi:MAG TPA: polysaccharide deacetylase family protein [Blastocatellia bacterium]|nr:polysaccharide deacetylase family protein [Blastocatellia bacterium]